LSNLNSTTSTRPKSVSLSSGITGRARKERIANGAGGKFPRLAAAFSTFSCWDTTTSSGSRESRPAMGKGKEARISRSAQKISPPGSQLIPSITSKVSGTSVSEALELVSLFCRCKVVGKTGFHLTDCGSEVSLPLQHNLNRKTLDTGRRFIIHCVIVEHSNNGTTKGIGVCGKQRYRHGLRSSGRPFRPLLESKGP